MAWALGRRHRLHEEVVDVGLAVDALLGLLDEQACLYITEYRHMSRRIITSIRDYFRLPEGSDREITEESAAP